jgi:hypothetical protein
MVKVAQKTTNEREHEVGVFMRNLFKLHHAYYPPVIAVSFNPPKEGENAKVDLKPLSIPSTLVKAFEAFFREAVEKSVIQKSINEFFLPVYLKAFALDNLKHGEVFSDSEQKQIYGDVKRALTRDGYTLVPEMTQELTEILKQYPAIRQELASEGTAPTQAQTAPTPWKDKLAQLKQQKATTPAMAAKVDPIADIGQKIRVTSDPQQLTALVNQQLIPLAKKAMTLDSDSINKAYEEIGEIAQLVHTKAPEAYAALLKVRDELSNKLSW